MQKLETDDIEEVAVRTADLATVVGCSHGYIRQLKMAGVLRDVAKGWYPLGASVRAIAEHRADRSSVEIKQERAALIRAQREALETKTGTTKASASVRVYQTATVRAVVAAYFLAYRLIPSWLFGELQSVLPGPEARRISGLVARWQISIRVELDRSLFDAVDRLNAAGKTITSERDLAVAIDPGNGLVEHYADHPEDMQESEQAMLETVESLDAHDAFNPPIDPTATNGHDHDA